MLMSVSLEPDSLGRYRIFDGFTAPSPWQAPAPPAPSLPPSTDGSASKRNVFLFDADLASERTNPHAPARDLPPRVRPESMDFGLRLSARAGGRWALGHRVASHLRLGLSSTAKGIADSAAGRCRLFCLVNINCRDEVGLVSGLSDRATRSTRAGASRSRGESVPAASS